MNNEELTKYQNETINTLEKMKEKHFEEIRKHQDEIDIINGVIAKFETEIFMKQFKFLKKDNN